MGVLMSESLPIEQARGPFHVLVKPIGPICNLRCEYCFYLTKKEMFAPDESFRMTDETLETLVRQYIGAQPDGTREINFGWQGGEPTLMGVDFFRRAVELQKQYARPGMTIGNGLQTNGTLLDDEWGRFLREENFLVGISIDGPKELHNRYRLDARGRGTFEEVMGGLEVLQRHKVEYNVLTVVQGDNAEHPREVYDFIADTGTTFLQLIPIVEGLGDGEVTDRSVGPEPFGRFMVGLFDRWLEREHVGKIFIQQCDMMLAIVMGYPAPLCCHAATCGRSTALEHNGDLYSCDHWVYPENLLGNVATASMAEMVDGEFQTAFGRDKSAKLPGYCRRCPHLRYCYGACPKDRLATTPDGEPGLAYLCKGYRMFYQHSLPVFEKMAECLRAGRPASDYKHADSPAPPSPTPARPQAPVGRNAPCPCGSGKKYKKCCMNKPGS